ncbi:MAG: transcriptional repressor LexA [Candidatus Omnitrophica bacterium]|nr:transcriptional repressor LexA [Candidatus Omnitrophota bacterium]HOX54623.1 transcriptional repressor LexA [Candidatus Omnitrophota bacterium]
MEIIKDLTAKQRKVLLYIQDKIKQEGIPPTIREIAASFGFSSTGTVRDYLEALKKKGYLKIAPKKSRCIELLRRAGFGIPILGNVMAGPPDLAFEEAQGYLDLDDFSSKYNNNTFALRIKGDSMIEAGIFEGDIAIVRKQSSAQDGDLIVALIENEATVKRFRHKAKSREHLIWLEPANKNYQPIHKEFSLIGRVIGVLRKYV